MTIKAFLISGILLLTAVLTVIFFVFNGGEDELSRVSIATTEEVDFDNGTAHTADAGIAVISSNQPEQIPDIIRMSTTQVQGRTDNPDNIWQDADDTLTFGGFTITAPALDGDSIGILIIPDIGLSARVYEGDDDMALMEKGVARFRHTSAWEGHIGLSAHNINMNGTPGLFLNIHTLKEGAIIRYETALGVREYSVERIFEVDEYDWSVLSRTQENRISMVTCITGKPQLRLIVTAVEAAN